MRTRTATWFEATVRYERQTENNTRKVNELYIVDAISFAEAEERIVDYITPFTSDDIEVRKLAIAPYTEIFFSNNDSDDHYYKARLAFITLNERTGKEKKSPVTVLIQASSLEAARKNIDNQMSDTAIDYEIKSITETPILNIFEYTSKSKE